MSFLLASAARATTGERSGQEDAFRLWPAEGVAKPDGEKGGLLAVLADGMGGHTGGAVAGQTACETFADVFAGAATSFDQRLQSALHASNEALARGVEQNAALRGMGCTIIGAWMDTSGIRWTSVGDSLLLLYRFPDVIRLNADHSLGSFLDEQARQNRITTAEAKQHHNRNALRSALTGAKIDLIDMHSEPLELQAGDWVLLASDGICSLEGDEIADVVYKFRESSPAEMADGLIAAVTRKGVAGQDNTTVVAVRVDPLGDTTSDLATTRVVLRPNEEKELRSRSIGMTGRKTSTPKRVSPPPKGRAVWLVAAAVFFLFFAVTMLMRSLQPTPPTGSDAVIPASTSDQQPLPDPSDTTTHGGGQQPVPQAAPEPATQEGSRVAPPDSASAPAERIPRASQPPITPKIIAPIPQKVTPPPQPPAKTTPSRSQPATSPDSQSTAPAGPPSLQPSSQPTDPDEPFKERRVKRAKREPAKDGSKEVPKEVKELPKSAPKEVPKAATGPRENLPWGFSND
jgi:PPM family protein phosphatase